MRNILKKTLCCAFLLAAFTQIASTDAYARHPSKVAAKKPGASAAVCKTLIPLGRLIWKGCAGSGHLTGDPRGQGAALIAPRGATTLNPPSCMPIYDSAFKRITGLQLYPGNNGIVYKWRGYTNYGCGTGTNMIGLRNKSKNKEIYVGVNSNSSQCIKIPKAFSNINSSQRC